MGDTPKPAPDITEPFLQRFHRRKLAARRGEALPPEPASAPVAAEDAAPAVAKPLLTDADMPPVESLTAESDFSGFLSAGVSEALRRAALRRLWQVADVAWVDELDVYAGDYTEFEHLGGLITAEMRHRLAREAARRAEALLDGAGEEAAEAGPVADDASTDAPDGEAAT